MNKSAQEEQRQLWLSRISDIVDSGLTQLEWCKRKEISLSTLRYWIRKLREPEIDEAEPRWLKVDVSTDNQIAHLKMPEIAKSAEGIKIKYGEFTVEFPIGCDAQSMLDILRLVKEV